MSEINSNLYGRERLPTTSTAAPDPLTETATADYESSPKRVLDGASLSVTSNPPDAALADLRHASYDSAMATAKNLVDDPKTRREKAERRKEEEAEKEALEADLKRADEKRELLDEIDSQRQASI